MNARGWNRWMPVVDVIVHCFFSSVLGLELSLEYAINTYFYFIMLCYCTMGDQREFFLLTANCPSYWQCWKWTGMQTWNRLSILGRLICSELGVSIALRLVWISTIIRSILREIHNLGEGELAQRWRQIQTVRNSGTLWAGMVF